MPGLPATQISYNGFTFPPATHARISARFDYDRSGRSVKYTAYTLHVNTVLTGGDAPTSNPSADSDDNLETVRILLSKSGGVLTLSGLGFGDDLTAISSLTDPVLGPHPRALDWTPIGGANAAKIEWVVDFYGPECVSGSWSYGSFLEYTYEVDYSIDEAGATTRTISGTVEVPAQYAATIITQTADDFWEGILARIQPIQGFKRRHSRRLGADKRHLSFTVTDTEINSNNPYPAGVAHIEGQHTVSGDLAPSSTNHLSLRMTLLPNVPKDIAFRIFERTLNYRILNANTGDGALDGAPRVVLQSYTFGESLFSREVWMEVAYTVLCSIEKVIKKTGIWTALPIHPNEYQEGVYRFVPLLGRAGLRTSVADDVVVSVCAGNTQAIGGNPTPRSDPGPDSDGFKQTTLTPEQSWLHWYHEIGWTHQANTAVHQKLGNPDRAAMQNRPQPNRTARTQQLSDGSYPNTNSQVVQDRAAGQTTLTLRGGAMRAGYPIQPPKVESVGGVSPTQTGMDVRSAVLGNLGNGVPLIGCWWAVSYSLPAYLSTLGEVTGGTFGGAGDQGKEPMQPRGSGSIALDILRGLMNTSTQ